MTCLSVSPGILHLLQLHRLRCVASACLADYEAALGTQSCWQQRPAALSALYSPEKLQPSLPGCNSSQHMRPKHPALAGTSIQPALAMPPHTVCSTLPHVFMTRAACQLPVHSINSTHMQQQHKVDWHPVILAMHFMYLPAVELGKQCSINCCTAADYAAGVFCCRCR